MNLQSISCECKKLGATLLDLMAPRYCMLCGKGLQLTERNICVTCDLDLPRANITDISDNRMLRLLWSYAPFMYATSFLHYRSTGLSRELIYSIKYRGGMFQAVELGKWAAKEVEYSILHSDDEKSPKILLRDVIDAIVPIPITRKRKLHRGYNQSEAIAEGISACWDIPYYNNIVKRTKETPTQTHLNAQERQINMSDAFEANIPPQLRGKHLLLVDDVMTTGATFSACADALLKSDPNVQISAFSIALDTLF